MSSAILKRLEKLETAATGGGLRIDWIIRRIIHTDSDGEATCAKYGETIFHRTPGETEQEFIERAQAEVMATYPKVTPRLIVSLDLNI
ncbi:MAG: hypothetical protein WBO95_08305 [Candidatus Dechloromonas phosphoritropha]